MTEVLAAPCWTREGAHAVLQTQALATSDAIFLATHSPVRDFEVAAEKFDVSEPSQEGLLAALSDPAREHAFCVIQGEPGSGKSHLIRWLQVNWPVEADFCLLIQRADGSLLGALKQLQAKLPSDLHHLFDGLGQQHAAGLTGRSELFLNTLGTTLGPDYFDDPLGDETWCRESDPKNLILSAAVRNNWNGPSRILKIMGGGKERNSASASFDISDVLEIANIWAEHDAGDTSRARDLGMRLAVESSHIEEQLQAGRTLDDIRQNDASEFPNTLQLVDALNARRNHAVQNVIGVSSDALKRLFLDLRAELARQDREAGSETKRRLVLLLEDVTMWEGLDDSLIDVLVADATLREDEDLCPLISVIGLTTEYYSKLKSNYQQRISHSVRLGVTADGRPKEIAALAEGARTRFVARYLAAVRSGPERLAAWRQQYRQDKSLAPPNACHSCARVTGCFDTFGEVDGVGLFPFTPEAVDRFYSQLKTDDQGQTHRTPRGMLQGVLNPTLLAPDRYDGGFPGPEIESRFLEKPFVDSAMNTLLEARVPDPDVQARLRRLFSYWGDLRAAVTEDEDGRAQFAGVRREVATAFGLPWVGDGIAVSAPANPVPRHPEPEGPRGDPEGPPSPRPPGQPRTPPRARGAGGVDRGLTSRQFNQLLQQIDTLRGSGVLASATEWNRVVHGVVEEIEPQRVGVDRRTFEQVFTAEKVKIEGTGRLTAAHLEVPRSDWLARGLEAYVRLESDDTLTDDQREFHLRQLAAMGRRLESLVVRHLRRLLPQTQAGHWSLPASIAQILLLRAWLRGAVSPVAPLSQQWTALLSDEAEATTGPTARTAPWQEALSSTDRRHGDLRQMLREMVSLPQGESRRFGLADAALTAVALRDLQQSLTLNPGVRTDDPKLAFEDWQTVRILADKLRSLLPRIGGEADLLKDRAARLQAMQRGKATGEHFDRLSAIIDEVSTALIGAATVEVRAWQDERRRLARLKEDPQVQRRLSALLWDLSQENTAERDDPAMLDWLIAAPALELEAALELFRKGEQAVQALLPHVRDLVSSSGGGVNLGTIHGAGDALKTAAVEAKAALGSSGQ